jgi:hypothetical protein
MRRSVRKRRAERELFFWTVERGLHLVRLAAVALPMAVFAVYVVVLMIEGALTGVDLLQHHTIIVYWPK